MTVSASGKKTALNDIYFGDVWICSGQSNMEMQMRLLRDDFPEEWEAPINQMIRHFKVPREWEFSGPRTSISGGRWATASEGELGEFSATAWFFAKEVFKTCGAPIGLVNASWEGTPVEAWMSREALSAFPEKTAHNKKYASSLTRDKNVRQNEAAIKAWNEALAIGDRGGAGKWQKPPPSLSQWGRIALPGMFSDIGLANFCGTVWFRKQFEASAEFAEKGARLWLGAIADADTVFVNGAEVGSTDSWCDLRKYEIPAELFRKGKNWIVIKITSRHGNGGIIKGKDFRVFCDGENVELAGTWEYRVGIRAAKPCPERFRVERQPTGLFNAMIAPLLDFPCKGILWYQGESNEANAGEYKELFAAHVTDWQGKWKSASAKTPFFFVQLPIYGKPEENNDASPWATLRDAQLAALSLPATGMAAALDLGEWNDIHPINKKDVGRRLALAVEKAMRKSRNTAPGPLLRSVERSQGRVLLRFDNCGDGLVASDSPYVTAITYGMHRRLPAEIEAPDCLSVDVSSAGNPEKVLYAWANNPRDRQLRNSDGLPVIPFRAQLRL